MKETFREFMHENEVQRMFKCVEPLYIQDCESCGGFDKNSEGFCKRMNEMQGASCWFPIGMIPVDGNEGGE